MIECISDPYTMTDHAAKPNKRPIYGGSYMPVDIGHALVSYYKKVPAMEMAAFCKCEQPSHVVLFSGTTM
jgi:hypothetical protein